MAVDGPAHHALEGVAVKALHLCVCVKFNTRFHHADNLFKSFVHLGKKSVWGCRNVAAEASRLSCVAQTGSFPVQQTRRVNKYQARRTAPQR